MSTDAGPELPVWNCMQVNSGNEVYLAAKVHYGFVHITPLIMSSRAVYGSTQACLILVCCSRCAVLSAG